MSGPEVLLRWQHPQQGLISPGKFMAAAEDTGLLVTIGHWVIREACKQLQQWTINLPTMERVSISVNISARQLADANFVRDLQSTLRETGIEPSLLHLEMTESVAASDPKLTEIALSHLKKLQVGVILDDFGTGNSSLNNLRKLTTLKALKIDRALINAMLVDRAAFETVELIILLAHKLKLKVIAEGIESAKELDRLHELGCDLGQGFLFSQPVEANAVEKLLRERAQLPHMKAAGA
jgi:EAL domain-containing protein (putative c-di-GMP-specific phosphodiesterase class I)